MKNLTKNLILVTLFFGIPSLSHAQDSKKEAVIISAGYGMPNLDALFHRDFDGNDHYSSVGPLHGKIEVKATKVLGIGLSVNYFNYKTNSSDHGDYYNNYESTTFTYKKTSIKFNIRTNLHYVRTSRFDLYAGFGLGYGASTHTKINWNSSTNSFNTVSKKNPFPMGFEVTQGVRMTLTNNFAMYAEVGMAQSFMQIGACYRFHGTGE